MKKTIQIITVIVLILAILGCSVWYLFAYDREFTRDMLLNCARGMESAGHHNTAAWFYNLAYNQSDDGDDVAIELAQQYKKGGNYTKAEYTLYQAISNGAGVDVYVALSQLYVEQDKLLDAVTMLNGITDETIKAQIAAIRPAAPTATPDPGFYNQYISVTLQAENTTIYYSTDDQYPSVVTPGYTSPITLSDGENTIQAISVASNGLVSQLAIFGYTVGGVIELVDFADPVIETEIRTLLSVPDTTQLFTNDLWEIKEFTIPEGAEKYDDIRHMAFLEKLTIQNGVSEGLKHISSLSNLTSLSITNTSVPVEVVESIATLPSLKALTLSGCSLTSIAPLEKATGLTFLDLSNNAIRDIRSISVMTALTEVYLQNNAIVDISPLASNTALTKADLSHNAITTLAPITSLTALTWLDANTNAITTLGEIGTLTALNYFSVSSNSVTDISQLSACTALTHLYIASNSIGNISALTSLENIEELDFSHNQVSELPDWSSSCALVTIDGSYNAISSLRRLGGLRNLNVINMDYNEEISSVDALSACPVLTEVNVYGTKVTDAKSLTSQSIIVNYNPIQ